MASKVVEAVIESEGLVAMENLKDAIHLGDYTWRSVQSAATVVLRSRRTPVFVLIDSLEDVGEHIDRLRRTLQGRPSVRDHRQHPSGRTAVSPIGSAPDTGSGWRSAGGTR